MAQQACSGLRQTFTFLRSKKGLHQVLFHLAYDVRPQQAEPSFQQSSTGSFKIGLSALRRRRRFAAPKMSWWNLIPSSVEREDDSLWIGQIVCTSRHRQPVEGFSIFLKSFPLNYASCFIRPLVVYTRVQLPLVFSSDTVDDVGEKKRIIYFQTQCLSPVRRSVSGTSWPDGGCVKTFGEAAYWLSAVIYASPHGEAGGSTGTGDCKCRVLKHSIYSFVVCVRARVWALTLPVLFHEEFTK